MAIWIPNLENHSGPLYLRIVEAMAADIASGVLAPGAKLLPHRELAYQLGISPNTVSRAYAVAVKRALLQGEVGRGTFVRRQQDAERGPAKPQTMLRADSGPIDLSRNLPVPGFADAAVADILEDLRSVDDLSSLLDYQTSDDLERHAAAGCQWLTQCGVEAHAAQVLVTVGVQHAIHSVLTALLRPGDLLLTEALTYTPVLAMASRLGITTDFIDMDEEGILPEALEQLCTIAKPKALYLTPTLQAPTTVTLSAERRKAIARLAETYNVIVIEDDVFGPLAQARPEPIAVSAPGHTVYLTGLSKAVAPGLRSGFVYAPASFVPALRQAINLNVWMTPPLTSEISSRLILNGAAAEITEQQRGAATRRRGIASQCLQGISARIGPDGLHVWLRLPEGWRADVFCAQCARNGVLVSEARAFAGNVAKAPEAIRLCLSHEASESRLEEGLKTVAALLRFGGSDALIDL